MRVRACMLLGSSSSPNNVQHPALCVGVWMSGCVSVSVHCGCVCMRIVAVFPVIYMCMIIYMYCGLYQWTLFFIVKHLGP